MAEALPLKVLINIFVKLDGRSFYKTKDVCLAWRNAHFYLITTCPWIWKKFCRDEIPPIHLLDIVEKQFPRNRAVSSIPITINWWGVYSLWDFYFVNGLNGFDTFAIRIVKESGRIECLKTCDQLVYYCTSGKGRLKCYDMKDKRKVLLRKRISVFDIDIMNVYRWAPKNEIKYYNNNYYLLENEYLTVYSSTTNLLYEAVYRGLNNVDYNEWCIKVIERICVRMDSLKIPIPYGICDANLVRNHVIVYVDKNEIPSYTLEKPTFVELWCQISLKTRWIIPNCYVAIGLPDDNNFHGIFFIVSKDIKLLPTPEPISKIKAALMVCNYLFLGNIKGDLYAYSFDNYSELFHINFLNWDKIYRICDEPITDVDFSFYTTNRYRLNLLISAGKSIYRLCFQEAILEIEMPELPLQLCVKIKLIS